MKNLKKCKAFTLVELIVVISIVSILMSLILPAAQKVLVNARKSKARAHMKQIAETYCRFYQDNGYIPDAESTVALIEKYAEAGELNNAHIFVFPGDRKAAVVLRENVWPVADGEHAWEGGKQLSVCLIGNIAREVSASTTPVAFSRGLDVDGGNWTAEDGVWGAEGGFVAFLDGQVRWYANLWADEGKLSTTSGPTGSMKEAADAMGSRILGNAETP
jgi:prepilin-type N-terminal cleavage/methylation domain-containing protein